MSVPTRAEGDALILSPSGPLNAGGPAEEFESSVQAIFKSGYRHLVADLREVTTIDSAGIRALVRGLTSSQRLEGSFKLVAPAPAVLDVIRTYVALYRQNKNWLNAAPRRLVCPEDAVRAVALDGPSCTWVMRNGVCRAESESAIFTERR